MLETDLYPVQILFLSRPKKTNVYSIFSTILKELILKKVIYYHDIKSYPNERSRKTQKYGMIMQGSNFYDYIKNELPFFEKVFLSPLEEIPKAQLRILTDYVTKRYNMPTQFTKREILGSLSKDGYMSSLPILRSLGIMSSTDKGKEITNQLNAYLEEITNKFNKALDGNNDQFITLIEETGVYTFFLEYTNNELYERIKIKTDELFEALKPGVDEFLNLFNSAIKLEVLGHEE